VPPCTVNSKNKFLLPDRNGVGPSCVALPAGDWPTVLDFLAQRFAAISRHEWSERMRDGLVLQEDGKPVAPDMPYRAYARLYYYRSLPAETPIPFEESVLFQDDYLVVADKPHFLPVTPSGRFVQETLLVRLKRKLKIETLTPMHRIDRETAGLVLFTIQPHTRNAYQALFRERLVSKDYEAIAPWRPDLKLPMIYRSRLEESSSFMQMREVEGEANTETRIALLERKADLARYALHPHTGRKHQLRAHMGALGIAILNDQIYPTLGPDPAGGAVDDFSKPLQLLAKSIAFTDPFSGQPRRFESRLALQF
jgi:tRNA pseudouridine32 synthase / 23S rRNA pseudouridine746 synthase